MNNVQLLLHDGLRKQVALRLALIIHCSVGIIHCSPAQSVLQTGVWLKIGVVQGGAYRLDYSALTRANGAFSSADPRHFRLYGNGGAALPQPNNQSRLQDLSENAIQVSGEADGKFDAADALLFYGQPTATVSLNPVTGRYSHRLNPYSDTTFYFLTIGPGNGLRMAAQTAGSSTTQTPVTTFQDYTFRENETTSPIQSGREWVGEYFGIAPDQGFTFDLPGRMAGAPVQITTSALVNATKPSEFRVSLGGQSIGTIPFDAISGYKYDHQGILATETFSGTATAGNPMRVDLLFDRKGQSGGQAYLNFLGIQTVRELRQYAQPITVRNLFGPIKLQQATDALTVWDITSPLRPAVQAVTRTGTEAAWAARSASTFYCFTDADYKTPASVAAVPNQNLRGLDTPDLLIVTAPNWQDQAERLARFRRSNDNLTTAVVTTQQIYNEFASGQPDPTAIRDFARFLDQKRPGQLKYLLLFGDATFDYRNKSKLLTPAQQAATVPVYESRESLQPVLSYSSDDYFGFFGDYDGDWPENSSGNHTLSIGIGRIPAQTPDHARIVVDKLIRYATDKTLPGDWQTRVMLVADDGDDNLHERGADVLGKLIEKQSPAYRVQRLFLDDFQQTTALSGQQAPAMNAAIGQAIADGRLLINYQGHGGESGWAQEQILTLSDIASWRNRRLPLLVTATCEFGRYDNPNVNSGAELSLLSASGGAIGLLTTTRPVFESSNAVLNQAFYNTVFVPDSKTGQMPRLGDVIRQTKNNSLVSVLNRNFALLGDPSMRLAYPGSTSSSPIQAVLTTVNSLPVSASRADTLRPLQTVELAGEIRQGGNRAGERVNDFSGTVRLTLFDKPVNQTTRGTESAKFTYAQYSNVLFSGQVAVQQGQFRARFTLPTDVILTFGNGRLLLFARKNDSLTTASGGYTNLIIGGKPTANPSPTPPAIVVRADGAEGSELPVRVIGPDVTLVVSLSDAVGINTATGQGHDLTLQLNDQNPLIISENYVATGVDGRSGTARYMFRNLAPGQYAVRVKGWNSGNISSEETFTFQVSDAPAFQVSVRAYPNPFAESVTIAAIPNRAVDNADWTMSIFDGTGRLLNEQRGSCADCATNPPTAVWDGQTNNGASLPNGLYLYRFRLRSAADTSEITGSGRIILNR